MMMILEKQTEFELSFQTGIDEKIGRDIQSITANLYLENDELQLVRKSALHLLTWLRPLATGFGADKRHFCQDLQNDVLVKNPNF
jgi:hypothetical protein